MSVGEPEDSTVALPLDHVPAWAAPVRAGELTVAGYRILEKLGEGGMGAVYVAEQQHPQRLVALKVLTTAASSDPYRQKLFAREIEMLARLQHPAIATIYGSGASPSGGSYFTMELVKGWRLDAFRDRDLTTAARLDLFLQICDGVSHAHQQGIIHRDLKPANIMVSEPDPGQRRAKVLDFGLARALESDAEPLSKAGTVMGTLRYMSPEQANGLPASTASDQYALGVILYELLTGQLPYDLLNLTMVEATKVIMEAAPKPAGLDEDLELILRKALQKEPGQRYASLTAFADDLRRYLRRDPILARPPSAWYILRRTVGRHRLAAALLGSLLITLVAGSATLLVFNRRLTAERNRAEQAAAFLTRIFQNSNPNRGGGDKVTAREILDNGAREIDTQLAGQPDLRAHLTTLIGESYWRLGVYSGATATLRRALEQQRQVHGPSSPEALRAMVILGETVNDESSIKAAEPIVKEALEIAIRAHGDDSLTTAMTRQTYAIVLRDATRFEEAAALAEKAYDTRRRHLGPDHDDTLSSQSLLGNLYTHLQRDREAEGALRSVYQARKQRYPNGHISLAVSSSSLARFLEQHNQHTEAEALHRETLSLRERLLPADHPSISSARSDLASMLQDRGEYEKAEPLYRAAVASALKTAGPKSRPTAIAMNNLASLLEETGRLDEAAELLEKSVAIRRELFGITSYVTQTAVDNLARVELARNRLTEAEALLTEIFSQKGTPRGRLSPETNLGLVRLKQNRVAEAEKLLSETAARMQKLVPGQVPLRALVDAAYGEALMAQKRYREALPVLQEAWEIRNHHFGPKSTLTSRVAARLEECKAKQ